MLQLAGGGAQSLRSSTVVSSTTSRYVFLFARCSIPYQLHVYKNDALIQMRLSQVITCYFLCIVDVFEVYTTSHCTPKSVDNLLMKK